MAETFKASRVVDAGVITGPFKGTLVYILAGPFICEEFIAFLAAAFKAANRVSAEMVTATIVYQAFVNIFARFPIRLQRKSNWATASYPRRGILASPITASIIDSTCFNAGSAI